MAVKKEPVKVALGPTFVVSKDVLLPALEVLDLVPQRPGIPAAEFIKIEGKKGGITLALSSEVSGVVNVASDDKWISSTPTYVDRRLFLPFVFAAKNLKSKTDFEFAFRGDQLQVRQGRRKAMFDKIAEVGGYGSPGKDKASEHLRFEDAHWDVAAAARNCAGGDPITPELNCVFFQPTKDGPRVYSTNEIIICEGVMKGKLKIKQPVAFPLFLIGLVGNNRIKEIHWRETEVLFEFEEGYIWQTVNAKARKGFPLKIAQSRLVEASKLPEKFKINCKDLGVVIARLGVYLTAVRRQDWVLKITGHKGKDEVLLETTVPQGVFKERLKTVSTLKEDFVIEWPLDALMEVLDFLGKKDKGSLVVKFGDKSSYYLQGTEMKLIVARKA